MENSLKYIILIGSIHEGWWAVGPFEDIEAANSYAEDRLYECNLMPLCPPADDEDEEISDATP